MSAKENPGELSPRIIDVESINRNVIGINSLSAKSQYTIGKSSPLLTIDNNINSASSDKDEIRKMLSEQRKRRDDAALRMPPMRCGCRDPLRCRCYAKRGAK